MQIPPWLRILTILICLNAGVVGWSIVQRHVLASSQVQVSGEELNHELPEQVQDAATDHQDTSANSSENLPALPPKEVWEAATGKVSEDDPLLLEIKKQVANQFGEPSMVDGRPEIDEVDLSSTTSIRPPTALAWSMRRLEVVAKLNEAAQLLLKIAQQQQQAGLNSQASQTLSRVAQLKALMIELLGE